MSLSRKDYTQLAEMFGTGMATGEIVPVFVGRFMDFLAAENPRFNRGVFTKAVEVAEAKAKLPIVTFPEVKPEQYTQLSFDFDSEV